MSEFGDNVKRLRRKSKLTQRDLASMLDVSKSTVGKWESSDTIPDAEGLKTVAALFGVPMYALFKEPKHSTQKGGKPSGDQTNREIGHS